MLKHSVGHPVRSPVHSCSSASLSWESMTELDIWRSVNILLKRYGAEAAILLLVSIWSTGCAAPQFEITAAIAQYRAAETCCHSLAEVRFGQLSSAPDIPVIIDSQSPAYNFAGMSLSYFGAFELPRSAAAMTLRIQSRFIQDGASPNIRDIFIPVIMLLDQQKNPIHVTDGQIGKSVSEAMISIGTPYVETTLDLRQFPAARYFVVFTRPELLGDPVMIEVMLPGSVIAAGRAMLQAAPVTYIDAVRASPLAPRGALTVSVQ
jgi:hypothetical protein